MSEFTLEKLVKSEAAAKERMEQYQARIVSALQEGTSFDYITSTYAKDLAVQETLFGWFKAARSGAELAAEAKDETTRTFVMQQVQDDLQRKAMNILTNTSGSTSDWSRAFFSAQREAAVMMISWLG